MTVYVVVGMLIGVKSSSSILIFKSVSGMSSSRWVEIFVAAHSYRADVVHLNLSDTRTDASDLKRTKPLGTSAHKRLKLQSYLVLSK